MTLTELKNDNQFYLWWPPEQPSYPCIECERVDCTGAKCEEEWEQSCKLARENAVLAADQEDIFILVNLLIDIPENDSAKVEKNKPYELVGFKIEVRWQRTLKSGDGVWEEIPDNECEEDKFWFEYRKLGILTK